MRKYSIVFCLLLIGMWVSPASARCWSGSDDLYCSTYQEALAKCQEVMPIRLQDWPGADGTWKCILRIFTPNPVVRWVEGHWRITTINGYSYWAGGPRYQFWGDPVPQPPIQGTSSEKTRGKPSCSVGDPISVGSANNFQAAHDYQFAGATKLDFTRYYNSQDDAKRALGYGWRHGYERRIVAGGDTVKAVRADGRIYTFSGSGPVLSADPDVHDNLVRTESGWRYTSADGTREDYDNEGRLLTLVDRAGRSQTLAYDDKGRLKSVSGPANLMLSFVYDDKDRMVQLSDPAGGLYTYAYDSKGNLSAVTFPDGSERHYQYTNSLYPHALTAVVDENGHVSASWKYSVNGWAYSSEHAAGTDSTQLSYGEDGAVTVTNALGRKTTYHMEVIQGVPKVVKVEGQPTPYCVGANRRYDYDSDGLLRSKTDWNGTTTTYEYNTRGLQTRRTEAVGTPEARTVTTEWSPDFRLPVKVTEPGQVTEFAYDANGRLLSRTTSSIEETQ